MYFATGKVGIKLKFQLVIPVTFKIKKLFAYRSADIGKIRNACRGQHFRLLICLPHKARRKKGEVSI